MFGVALKYDDSKAINLSYCKVLFNKLKHALQRGLFARLKVHLKKQKHLGRYFTYFL